MFGHTFLEACLTDEIALNTHENAGYIYVRGAIKA